jgi:hypothetical protein
MPYFQRYLNDENILSKIPPEIKKNFRQFKVANENCPIFCGNYFRRLLEINLKTAENYSTLFSAAAHRPPKYYWPSFGIFFPSRRKFLYTRDSTHLHFNFTPVLNWKIIHVHIIIHNNHTQQSYTIISSIQHSHPYTNIIH